MLKRTPKNALGELPGKINEIKADISESIHRPEENAEQPKPCGCP